MAAFSALDVSMELRKRLPEIGTKKLHKLLYYCQGHHLAAFGEPLFRDPISAWDMGPVVGPLWNFERLGREPSNPPRPLGEAELNTVGYVLSRYGALSAADLEHLTHSEDPWHDANEGRDPRKSVTIPIDSMKAYFESAAAAEEDDMPPLDSEALAQLLAGAEERFSKPRKPDSMEDLRSRLTGVA